MHNGLKKKGGKIERIFFKSIHSCLSAACFPVFCRKSSCSEWSSYLQVQEGVWYCTILQNTSIMLLKLKSLTSIHVTMLLCKTLCYQVRQSSNYKIPISSTQGFKRKKTTRVNSRRDIKKVAWISCANIRPWQLRETQMNKTQSGFQLFILIKYMSGICDVCCTECLSRCKHWISALLKCCLAIYCVFLRGEVSFGEDAGKKICSSLQILP